ncbi:glycoside hydrolase [Nitzschia inconspicua]|uniref:Glycoside hydrolase n=1 Tax=Nitzschia inconspicua TaxID=303405 RepID=A0A9K3KEU1_9STRA|nr:glycoside hydrolase [Nitzschia inconspicua]
MDSPIVRLDYAKRQPLLAWRVLSIFVWVDAVAISVPSNLPSRACVFPHNGYPFCNSSLPLDERIDDLISRLTLEEKPWLLTARYSPKGNISRLGIPEYDWGANCMHGVQSRCSPVRIENGTVVGGGQCPTSFPNANSLGSTFNKTLWRAMGTVIGLELRALWLQNVSENTPDRTPHLGLDCWSPNINIQRDPRWGRNLESPSEDPFLCGVYGTMHTLGLQNNSKLDHRYLQAVATLKHFDANSIEGPFWTPTGEWSARNGSITRHNTNAIISSYDMTTTYLPAFAMAVQKGGAAGIMCSFNRINGVPSCANEWLLQKVLRSDWKFRGYVTSDTGGLDDIRNAHHYTADWNETVAVALRAGCDIESAMWTARGENDGRYIDHIPNAVRLGLVSEADVDRAVRNALEIRFRLGLFDPVEDQPLWNISPEIVQSEPHVQLAKEATAQSLVLLKNDNNIVPITPTNTIALIGPHIHDRSTILGNYLGEVCRGDKSNGCVTSIYEGFGNVTESVAGPLSAAEGCRVMGNDTSRFDEAVGVASMADTVVFVGGLDGVLEGEDKDRPDIRLPLIQQKLLHKIARVNPRVILVLLHGGMIGLDGVIDQVQAIVSMGYPGPYAGTVLPKALYGIENRAWGKTAITWYHDEITEKINMLNFDMGRSPGRTYRYYNGNPNFRFGHGLNPLTKFELKFASSNLPACSANLVLPPTHSNFDISVSVANTGVKAADEVVMCYFVPLDIPRSEPASRLREQLFGFERIHLDPGASTIVAFPISEDALRLADYVGTPLTFSGQYLVSVTNGLDIVQQTVFVTNEGIICRDVPVLESSDH